MDKIVPYIEWNSIDKKFRSSWKPVRHSNITVELHIILEGNCMLELDERTVELNAGQAIVIMPNTFHTCKSFKEPFLRLTVSFILQDLSVLYGDKAPEINYFVYNVDEPTKRICYDIFAEYDKRSSYLGNEMISALFSQLLVRFLRTVQPHEQNIDEVLKNDGVLHIIDTYFSSFNMQGGHTRKGLSELLNCSERQLNRILTKLCGMTFLEKRMRSRMDYAKFLLRNTDLKISEISNMVGYSNETSFYKVFKTNCGETPQFFRDKYQNTKK